MGVAVNPGAIQVRNVAAVMITASLPPFAQPGTKIGRFFSAAAIIQLFSFGICNVF